MRPKFIYTIFFCLAMFACNTSSEIETKETWKQEILKSEQQFADMVKEQGIQKAFVKFAAEDAVLMRSDSLIIGKNNIEKFYENQMSKGLSWSPDFIDVSDSGDLGYTYGHYTFTYADSLGSKNEATGVFHTVWKRQSDGSWRFVWD